MMSSNQGKVSTWARVLSWIIVVGMFFTLGSWIVRLVNGGSWRLGWIEITIGAVGMLLLGPVFVSIAVKGRTPRWWSSYEDAIDIEKALNRRIEKQKRQ